jgi:hypothetical protein
MVCVCDEKGEILYRALDGFAGRDLETGKTRWDFQNNLSHGFYVRGKDFNREVEIVEIVNGKEVRDYIHNLFSGVTEIRWEQK